MIVKTVKGDVRSQELPIIFALNCEGFNDSGFAGSTSAVFHNTGPQKLGTILREGKYIGCVMHSLLYGWHNATKYLEECLKQIPETELAAIEIGAGPIGKLSGAEPERYKEVMWNSDKQITLYVL